MGDKFYITTAIDYVNAAPHLGHALEKIQADVIARYQRLLGKDVFFLTGTDEHGRKIARSAEETGKDIEEFVAENAEKFKNFTKALNISNDDFIRTSDKARHWPAAKKLWEKIKEKGDIYKGNYKGLYCVGCEAFITKKDLINGRCQAHNEEPESINEENYFFKLSAYKNKIKKALLDGNLKIIPETRKNEVLNWLEEATEDISFSRPVKDISWGIPAPDDESQTMYVWADALSNYISALGYDVNGEKFRKYWPADIHIIGKDILRFHAVIWPGMLLSAGLELPKNILVHGHITFSGKKMSKTLGNIINPFDIIGRYGVDALRYYLSREIPVFEDGDLTEEKFKEAYNANLANGLGNYTARVLKMAEQYFSGIIEKPDESEVAKVPLLKNGKEYFSISYVLENFVWPEYGKAMDNFELNKAMDIIWQTISMLDGYIQDYQPFKLINSDKERTRLVLWGLLFGLANIGWFLKPFLPETADKILKAIGADEKQKSGWKKFQVRSMEPLFLRK
jgi:methionyl-tRNA synthetase